MNGISRVGPRLIASTEPDVSVEQKSQKTQTGIAETRDSFDLADSISSGSSSTAPSAQAPIKPAVNSSNSSDVARLPDPGVISAGAASAFPPDSAAISGASAISIKGATIEGLKQSLEMLKNLKEGIVVKIETVTKELMALKIELALQYADLRATGGKGSGDLTSRIYGTFQKQKALEAELGALTSELTKVELEIKQTLEQIEKLNSV